MSSTRAPKSPCAVGSGSPPVRRSLKHEDRGDGGGSEGEQETRKQSAAREGPFRRNQAAPASRRQ